MGWFVKNTGLGPSEGACIVITGSESVAVYLGIATLGQGHETVMAQICADALAVPMEWITVFHGSTDLMPFGGGTYSSRGTVMAGSAVHLTALELKRKLLALAARRLETDPSGLEFRAGYVRAVGGEEPLLGFEELLDITQPGKDYAGETPGLEATEYFNTKRLTYTYGGHLVHLTVDPETGQIEILRYLVLEDIGRCINPLLTHGQALGAAAQGIRGTLLEELAYSEDGQLLTTTFLDYPLPSSMEIPPVESVVTEFSPSPLNPLGVKGVGEGGIVGCGAALANAVSHALSSLGVQIKDLPLTPDKIRRLIREGGRADS